jgi:hypothetical protein
MVIAFLLSAGSGSIAFISRKKLKKPNSAKTIE